MDPSMKVNSIQKSLTTEPVYACAFVLAATFFTIRGFGLMRNSASFLTLSQLDFPTFCTMQREILDIYGQYAQCNEFSRLFRYNLLSLKTQSRSPLDGQHLQWFHEPQLGWNVYVLQRRNRTYRLISDWVSACADQTLRLHIEKRILKQIWKIYKTVCCGFIRCNGRR